MKRAIVCLFAAFAAVSAFAEGDTPDDWYIPSSWNAYGYQKGSLTAKGKSYDVELDENGKFIWKTEDGKMPSLLDTDYAAITALTEAWRAQKQVETLADTMYDILAFKGINVPKGDGKFINVRVKMKTDPKTGKQVFDFTADGNLQIDDSQSTGFFKPDGLTIEEKNNPGNTKQSVWQLYGKPTGALDNGKFPTIVMSNGKTMLQWDAPKPFFDDKSIEADTGTSGKARIEDGGIRIKGWKTQEPVASETLADILGKTADDPNTKFQVLVRTEKDGDLQYRAIGYGVGGSVKVDGASIVTNETDHMGEIAIKGFYDSSHAGGVRYYLTKVGDSLDWTDQAQSNKFSDASFAVSGDEVNLRGMQDKEGAKTAIAYQTAGGLEWLSAENAQGKTLGVGGDGKLGWFATEDTADVESINTNGNGKCQIYGWEGAAADEGSQTIAERMTAGGDETLFVAKNVNGYLEYVKAGDLSSLTNIMEVTNIIYQTVTNIVQHETTNLTYAIVTNMTQTTVSNVVNSMVTNLTSTAITNVTYATVTNLVRQMITNLTYQTVTNVVNTQVTNLTYATVSNIVSSTITNLAYTTLTNVVANEITNLTYLTVTNMTYETLTNVVSSQITNLTYSTITNVVNSQITNLTYATISNLTYDVVSNTTYAVVSNFVETTISNEIYSTITNVVQNEITNLTYATITNVVSTELTNLTYATITNIVANETTNLFYQTITNMVMVTLETALTNALTDININISNLSSTVAFITNEMDWVTNTLIDATNYLYSLTNETDITDVTNRLHRMEEDYERTTNRLEVTENTLSNVTDNVNALSNRVDDIDTIVNNVNIQMLTNGITAFLDHKSTETNGEAKVEIKGFHDKATRGTAMDIPVRVWKDDTSDTPEKLEWMPMIQGDADMESPEDEENSIETKQMYDIQGNSFFMFGLYGFDGSNRKTGSVPYETLGGQTKTLSWADPPDNVTASAPKVLTFNGSTVTWGEGGIGIRFKGTDGTSATIGNQANVKEVQFASATDSNVKVKCESTDDGVKITIGVNYR